jgi:hypothetical protein
VIGWHRLTPIYRRVERRSAFGTAARALALTGAGVAAAPSSRIRRRQRASPTLHRFPIKPVVAVVS